MTVRAVPARTIGPGLLLDESANSGILPPGAILSTVMVTFCPSLNIGSRGDTTGAAGLAAVCGGGATAGAVGATGVAGGVAGEGGGATGVEAWLLGLGTAWGTGVGGVTGFGAMGFGVMATGGGVLSPR